MTVGLSTHIVIRQAQFPYHDLILGIQLVEAFFPLPSLCVCVCGTDAPVHDPIESLRLSSPDHVTLVGLAVGFCGPLRIVGYRGLLLFASNANDTSLHHFSRIV